MAARPQIVGLANDGGRRPECPLEQIFRELLEWVAGLEHGAFAFLTKEINPPLGQQRQSEVLLVQSLGSARRLDHRLARHCVFA